MFGSALEFNPYFGETVLVASPEDLKKVKVLVVWGGEDISPSLYNEYPIHTYASATPSKRDLLEKALIEEAVRQGKPILGICRGAQLLCALHGGSLWQHVDGHAGRDHIIEVAGLTSSKIVGYTNSAHHQMMRPDSSAKILARVPNPLSPKKWGQSIDPENSSEEPEIVWFPNFRALGVQGHPEWQPKTSFLSRITIQLFERATNATYSWR